MARGREKGGSQHASLHVAVRLHPGGLGGSGLEPPGPQRRRGRTDEEHGRSVAFYHSFGEYDGVIIFESPDDTSAAAGLLAAISPRHVKAIKKTTLLSVEDAIEAMRRAGEVPYENRDSRPICVKGAGA